MLLLSLVLANTSKRSKESMFLISAAQGLELKSEGELENLSEALWTSFLGSLKGWPTTYRLL